jgi:hypothetical protein
MSGMMSQDKSKPQDQEVPDVSSDPVLNKQAINEVVDEYERSANSDESTELDFITQKELGEVERALEDSVMGIEDAS